MTEDSGFGFPTSEASAADLVRAAWGIPEGGAALLRTLQAAGVNREDLQRALEVVGVDPETMRRMFDDADRLDRAALREALENAGANADVIQPVFEEADRPRPDRAALRKELEDAGADAGIIDRVFTNGHAPDALKELLIKHELGAAVLLRALDPGMGIIPLGQAWTRADLDVQGATQLFRLGSELVPEDIGSALQVNALGQNRTDFVAGRNARDVAARHEDHRRLNNTLRGFAINSARVCGILTLSGIFGDAAAKAFNPLVGVGIALTTAAVGSGVSAHYEQNGWLSRHFSTVAGYLASCVDSAAVGFSVPASGMVKAVSAVVTLIAGLGTVAIATRNDPGRGGPT